MIQLPNNCKCSILTVYPKTWRQVSAPIKKNWYVQYWFYDATGKKTLNIIKKGINRLSTAKERKEFIEGLLEGEMDLLKQGYNPNDKRIHQPNNTEISPYLPVLHALKLVKEKLTVADSTKADIKSMFNFLPDIHVPVGEVKRKNILQLLHGITSPHKFNKYRSYLSVLFEALIQLDVIDSNPALGIKKMKTVKKLREVMTKEERQKVNDHLKTKYYTFWRFMQIFYHSGAREIELLRVKVKDVDLPGQRFKVTVLKGKQPVEMWRTIKDIALPLWIELLEDSKPQQFVFSEQLKPGKNQIRREQITRRWNEHVKIKLGIDKDFYSLKHSAATDTAEILGNLAAAQHMGHTDDSMVKKVYNVEHETRKRLTVKELKNEL